MGEEFGAWENMAAGTRGVTVEGLINGQEYVFEVRAVNALGKGGAETADGHAGDWRMAAVAAVEEAAEEVAEAAAAEVEEAGGYCFLRRRR